MKFWQYAVGGLLAVLVFSAVLIADNMQFSQRNSFSLNPFSLMGVSHAPFGGEIQFLPSGEMMWGDEGVALAVTDEKRELKQGTVVLGGTFFPTEEDMPYTNTLWFGQDHILVQKTSALVNIDAEGMVTIVSGGGAVQLFFDGQTSPFVIPADSRVVFDINKTINRDPALYYYDLSQELSLAPLGTGAFVTQLRQAEQALGEWRSQFGHFAWNLPALWEAETGGFLQFLERITPVIPAEKSATRNFQEITIPIQQARTNIEEDSTKNLLQQFRLQVLGSDNWRSLLQESEQAQKEWTWFEFAQKIWLPVVSPDANEQKFSVLWQENSQPLEEHLRVLTLLSHNERWLRAEKEFSAFAQEFSKTEFSNEDISLLRSLRREVGTLLQRFSLYQSFENFQLWTNLIRTEQEHLSPDTQSVIAQEVAHDLLSFIATFISEENDASITQLLNGVWFDLPEDDIANASFSAAEQTTIQLIELVGVSGMTPEQAQKIKQQEQQREDIADQLEALLLDDTEEEAVVDMGISNAKKLWEFLANEGIDLDLSSFRTTRTETELTTRFANTAEGKRKIEGVFDYHKQKFIMLTLGEETTSDLSAHRLGRWIKNIGGKFESTSSTQETEIDTTPGVIQTAPQAILSRKLVQELLKSLGIDVRREQIEMKDATYQKSIITGAIYGDMKLNAEYDLLTQMFSRISLQRAESMVSYADSVSANALIKTLDQLRETLPDKN